MSERTVCRTTRGVVFASVDGVYLYDGAQLRPLMDRRIAKLWQSVNSPLLVTGAAVVKNHYIIPGPVGTNTTYICNLDTLAWGRVSGGCVKIMNALDPGTGTIWALRYPGLSTTFVGGQVVQIDQLFNPTSSNRSDTDGTAVAPTVKTRSYVDGDANVRKKYRRVQVEYDLRGAGTLTVSADTKLKVSDASYTTLVTGAGATTIGTTSASSEVTFDSGSKLAKGVAVEYQIAQTSGSDSTEILGLKHGLQQMRQGRSN